MEKKIDLVEIIIGLVFVLAAIVAPAVVAYASHGLIAAIISAVFYTAFWGIFLRATSK